MSSKRLLLFGSGKGHNGVFGQRVADIVWNHPHIIATGDLEHLDVDIISAKAGWTHSVVLDKQGSVYLFGRSHDIDQGIRVGRRENALLKKFFSILGIEKSIDYILPQKVIFDSRDGQTPLIKQIAAGAGTTAMLSSDGDLYVIGSNIYGQCCIGERSPFAWVPLKASSANVKLSQVDLGFRHGVGLSTDGSVYTWGKGGRGQLALGKGVAADKFGLHHVELLDEKCIKVAAGFAHTAALMESGEVFIWGKIQGRKIDPNSGNYVDLFAPERVKFETDRKMVDLWVGQHHSIALDDEGNLWQWGMLSDKTLLKSDIAPTVHHQLNRNKSNSSSTSSAARSIVDPIKIMGFKYDKTCMKISPGFDHSFISGEGIQMPMVLDWSLRPYDINIMKPEWGPFFESHEVSQISDGWQHTLLVASEK